LGQHKPVRQARSQRINNGASKNCGATKKAEVRKWLLTFSFVQSHLVRNLLEETPKKGSDASQYAV
jgi:hypothetical protein